MIWNSPISPNQTDSQTNSSGMITDLVRVRALRIAAAYIKSMDNSALLALSGNCCPGNIHVNVNHLVTCNSLSNNL